MTYLAVDLGASSGRAVIGRLEGGRMLMEEVHRFPTPLVEENGHLYWDIETLWQEIHRAVARALELEPSLRSISIDSWAVDYVPLDANGRALRNPYSYRDTRTRGRLDTAICRAGGPDALYDLTGIQFLELNTLPQVVADIEDEPRLVEQTATRLMIAEYFLYRLCGELVVERTMASTTQLVDARTGAWAESLVRAIGDDPARWPRIVGSGSVLGNAKDFAGAPLVIATCSHDTAAAVAAVPADDEHNWTYICSGTWSLVGIELRAPLLSKCARTSGFTNEAGIDGTTRLLKNRTGMWVLEECMREWRTSESALTYESLMLEAGSAASNGTLDLDAPHFAERGGMPEKVSAACAAQGLTHGMTRGEVVRVILESLAAGYARTLGELESLTGTGIEVVHVVGGGSRNALLNQLTATTSGRRVIAGPDEATTLGNLLVQARALGDLPSGATIRSVAHASSQLTTYLP